MQITRIIDHRLYPRNALAEARQAFQAYCTFKLKPLGDERVQVVITVRPLHIERGKEIVLEFLNYALDKAAETHFEAVP